MTRRAEAFAVAVALGAWQYYESRKRDDAPASLPTPPTRTSGLMSAIRPEAADGPAAKVDTAPANYTFTIGAPTSTKIYVERGFVREIHRGRAAAAQLAHDAITAESGTFAEARERRAAHVEAGLAEVGRHARSRRDRVLRRGTARGVARRASVACRIAQARRARC